MLLDLADQAAIPSASQDVVTANFAIMSTDKLESALKEVRRVLKPGGFLVGTVWHGGAQYSAVPVAARCGYWGWFCLAGPVRTSF